MLLRSKKGQGLAEYALILALIALVVIGAVIALGSQIQTIMQGVADGI
jgi:pilus assembly protein Flp/PilA